MHLYTHKHADTHKQLPLDVSAVPLKKTTTKNSLVITTNLKRIYVTNTK